MCGVVAIFAYAADAPPVDPAELHRIREAMWHRGPDGEGSWIADDGHIGLAHRRLSIIDLTDQGAQPMALAEGDLRITYNGEVYNFKSLRAELEEQGHRFRGFSDTEVLLHLYRRYGAEMVHKLRGMYAFALWDGARRGLLLARDPFGIKPLYIADDGRTVRVASQVKALRAGGAAGVGADPAGHVGFYLFGYVPEPHTLYRDIRAVPAGATLWIDSAGPRTPLPFFDPSIELSNAEETPAPALAETLRDSVRHHLVSDVPVGVFLSAGLDSATVVALAAELGSRPATLTLGFDEYAGTSRDEVPLAQSVANAYGTDHGVQRITAADFDAHRDALLAAMDQPTIDGVNTYFVARAAAGLNMKVALSGLGGDEIFAGYDTFRQIPALVRRVAALPGAARLGQAARFLSASWIAAVAPPKAAGVLELGARYGDAYLLRRGLFMPWELHNVLEPDLVRAGMAALDPRGRLEATHRAIGEPVRKVAALEIGWYLRNQLLRDADWAGMAHSLEIRVPFVDIDLFRALSPVMGRPGAPTKRTMAECPAQPLPKAVLQRPKSGFFTPVESWAANANGRKERGLRGWARTVYAAATAPAPAGVSPTAQPAIARAAR